MSATALFVALGGTSYAAIALPADSVGSGQIRQGAVGSSEVANRSLLAKDFKRGELPAGEQGPIGAAGPAGAAGANGETGPIGAAGAAGAAGLDGPAGPKGDTGAAGADGAKGDAGPKGDKGDNGADGAVGPTGPEGPAGPQGPEGPQGPQGVDGAPGGGGGYGEPGPQGPQGEQGLTGAQGEPGPTGQQGAQGEPGPAGPSGYGPVPSGTTIGSALRFNRYDLPANGNGYSSISLPTELAASTVISTGGSDPALTSSSAACTGSVSAPTAPAGRLCVYVGSTTNLVNESFTVAPLGGPDGFRGIALRYQAADAATSTGAIVAWAYTAP